MKPMEFLSAMTYINSAYILSAQKKLGYLPENPPTSRPIRGRTVLRKALALAAALMIATSVLFITALAVSEDFRDYVFHFFRVEQTEIVPEYIPQPDGSQPQLQVDPRGFNDGGVIEGRYVHTPTASQAENGLFLLCTEELETKQGSRYDAYYEENGQFTKLEPRHFSGNYRIREQDFSLSFDWVSHEGSLIITGCDPDAPFRLPGQNADPSRVLLWLQLVHREDGSYRESIYPILLDLTTGQLTDPLAGTGADILDNIVNAAITPDAGKMLLACGDGSLWYADLERNRFHSIADLSGEPVDSCTLAGNTLACWRQEAGKLRAWKIDLTTLERTPLFDPVWNAMATEAQDAGIVFLQGFDTWIHEGNAYLGSAFALMTTENGSVYAIDLEQGGRTQIEGFHWPVAECPDIQRLASRDGKKLLLAGGNAGENFRYLGILDFEKHTYGELLRENTTGAEEYLAGWFDEDTVLLRPRATELSSDYYLYTLNAPELFAVEQENVDIGGVIRGTYVHTPAASHARSGIYQICTDETEMNSGNHYDAYALENGSFVKLEEQWFDREITVQGVTVPMKFEWTEHEGNVAVTYVDSNADYRFYGLSGSADSVLVEVSLPNAYPVLLNLRTGAVSDVLSGTGAEKLGGIANAALTEDRSKMLLVTYDRQIYLADLKTKALLSVDALSGQRVEECTVIGNTLVCWTLDGASVPDASLGNLRAWNIDLATLERRELFSLPATPATSHDVWSEYQGDVTFDEEGNLVWLDKVAWDHAGIQFLDGFNQTIHWGNMYAGSCFAVEVDQQRNVFVIDLLTGEKIPISGCQWPETAYPLLECAPSPDGKKLLVCDRSSGQIGRVGVLDFERKAWFEFDRENAKAVDEHLIYWFDHDSIIITAESGSLIRDYYIYRLTP